MLLADFDSYIKCQESVSAAYRDQDTWNRKSILNVAGTAGRLVLIKIFGKAFNTPINWLLHLLQEYRIPLLVIGGLAFAFTIWNENRKGTGEVRALIDLEEEFDADLDGDLDEDALVDDADVLDRVVGDHAASAVVSDMDDRDRCTVRELVGANADRNREGVSARLHFHDRSHRGGDT